MFDADNLNTNWKDADLLELKQIYNFDTFESLGPVKKAHIVGNSALFLVTSNPVTKYFASD